MHTGKWKLVLSCIAFVGIFGTLSTVNAAEDETNIVVSVPENTTGSTEVQSADVQQDTLTAVEPAAAVPATVGTSSTPKIKRALKIGVNEAAEDTLSRRERFKRSLSLEVPWNGIVGTGLFYTYRPNPKYAIEGGAGLSSMGLKYGVRGRYCFSENKTVSGSTGIGISGVSGIEDMEISLATSSGDSIPLTFDIKPITFVQITGGFDILTRGGLFILLNTGWAIPLNDGVENVKFNNLDETSYLNSPNSDPDVVDAWNIVESMLYRGGLVLSASIGFSF